MIKYTCDICDQIIKSKSEGFVLTVEPLVEPKPMGLDPEDSARHRALAKSILVCSKCFTNISEIIYRKANETEIVIAIGDKRNALVMDKARWVVTPEMRIYLKPQVVHSSIVKYLSEIDQMKGGKDGKKNVSRTTTV